MTIDRDSLKAMIDQELSKYGDTETGKETVSKPEVDETADLVTEDLAKDTSSEEDVSQTETSDEDPYLKEALEMGYNPNYKGPNKKSPEQFVRDGSFFKKIDAQKKELQELKELVKMQLEHTRKVEKAAAEKKLAEAQQEKLDMISRGDIEGFKIAEQKEQAVKEMLVEPIVQQTPVVPAPLSDDIKSFVERNKSWCNFDTPENKAMAEDADLILQRTAQRNPGKSEQEILSIAEESIKRLYPHRFENPNLKKPSMVGHSTGNSTSKSSGLASKLTPRQLEFAKMAQRVDKNFSIEQYAKELKLTGELNDE
jgi:hypothetical protein